MKHSIRLLSILFAFVALTLFVQEVLACSCSGRESPYEVYQRAKKVFVGKVVEIKDNSGNKITEKSGSSNMRLNIEAKYTYRFAVQESFKDAKSSEIVIIQETNMCEPGFNLNDGGTFVVENYSKSYLKFSNASHLHL